MKVAEDCGWSWTGDGGALFRRDTGDVSRASSRTVRARAGRVVSGLEGDSISAAEQASVGWVNRTVLAVSLWRRRGFAGSAVAAGLVARPVADAACAAPTSQTGRGNGRAALPESGPGAGVARHLLAPAASAAVAAGWSVCFAMSAGSARQAWVARRLGDARWVWSVACGGVARWVWSVACGGVARWVWSVACGGVARWVWFVGCGGVARWVWFVGCGGVARWVWFVGCGGVARWVWSVGCGGGRAVGVVRRVPGGRAVGVVRLVRGGRGVLAATPRIGCGGGPAAAAAQSTAPPFPSGGPPAAPPTPRPADPGVLQGRFGGHARLGPHHQQLLHERLVVAGQGDVLQKRPLPVQNGLEQLALGRAQEREPLGGEEVRDDPEGPQVGGHAVGAALDIVVAGVELFRGHVVFVATGFAETRGRVGRVGEARDLDGGEERGVIQPLGLLRIGGGWAWEGWGRVRDEGGRVRVGLG